MLTTIEIDPEMLAQAEIESGRRDKFIKHHFEVEHLSYEQRDKIGFLGEFACCKLLGIDWKKNIRNDYIMIDDFDLLYKNKRIDVKTETIPFAKAVAIANRNIKDDEVYGRRLINEHQWGLLNKYDIIIFGMFIRDAYDKWFPIGFQQSSFLLKKYSPQSVRPDGGIYPFPAAAIRTSDLISMEVLLK